MSFIPSSTAIQEKISALTASAHIDPEAPLDFAFFADKIKALHGQLQSRLCEYFTPKNAQFCSKLIYSIPISLVLKTLSAPQTAVLGIFGGICLWSCKEEFISKNSKINLIHSVALAFFTNILSFVTDFSAITLIKLPINAALLGASLLMGNQIEENMLEEGEILTTEPSV